MACGGKGRFTSNTLRPTLGCKGVRQCCSRTVAARHCEATLQSTALCSGLLDQQGQYRNAQTDKHDAQNIADNDKQIECEQDQKSDNHQHHWHPCGHRTEHACYGRARQGQHSAESSANNGLNKIQRNISSLCQRNHGVDQSLAQDSRYSHNQPAQNKHIEPGLAQGTEERTASTPVHTSDHTDARAQHRSQICRSQGRIHGDI
mmetsp:Transcript_32447/g.84254  ORF Transcript_32447/g.84254 Transcript_32447/m.84254 type:complete len:204 (+) Transcript_32447:57-668(+)